MSSQDQINRTDEITFKESILTFREYFNEIKKSLFLIGLICLPFLGYQLYKNFTAKEMFEAPLSFMINEESGNSMGAISGLLGQFGFGGSSGDENIDKILELSKSRNISQSTLFNQVSIDGKTDYLANHVIGMLETNKLWNKKGIIPREQKINIDDFRFVHDSIAIFTLQENKALKHLHDHLIGNSKNDIKALISSSQNEQTGIMYFKANTYDPELSVKLSKHAFTELSKYYIEKTIEKQEHTYKLIRSKTDSIYAELQAKNYQLANFKDKNRGLTSRTDQIKESNLMIDIQKLAAMYGEATKNLEIADFTVRNKTPFIQLIDEPVLPIDADKPSLVKSIILGLIIGLFFGIAYVVTRKIVRESLA